MIGKRTFQKMITLSVCLWAGLFAALGVSSAPAQMWQTKLENPQVGYPQQRLGRSIAVDGNTMIVGAPFSAPSFLAGSGTARVYVRDGMGKWVPQAELTASDAAANDYFGWSVSISGDTVIVGARLADVGALTDAGAAYIFTRSGSTWIEQAKLTASLAAAGDQFGLSVAVSGDTAIAGAPNHDDGGSNSGSAYVFTRSGSIWTQQQKLNASDAAASDNFGYSVAVSGDTAVVGAAYDDVGALTDSGSAYIFTRSGSTWSEQKKLTADDAADGDTFGIAVSAAGDTAVVGAIFDDTGALTNTGSAYIFTRSGTVWTQQQKLTAADAAAGEDFGWSVSVSGDTAVVGAYLDDTGTLTDSGSAYIFTRSGAVWTQQQKLTAADAAAGDNFGYSVAVSGNTAVVGASLDDVGATAFGSAYIFTRSGIVWSQQQKFIASDAAADDWFGYSVAISGDTAVVGAFLDDAGAAASGSAYVFTHSGGMWTPQAKLTASDAAMDDVFGSAVSVSGDTAVVGAFGALTYSGSAYVFTRSGGVWTQQAKLTASDATADDFFGVAVAVSGDTIVVGAGKDDVGTLTNSGSAYVFTRSGSTWTQQKKLTASDAAMNDRFGYSVSVSGDTVVVGAYANSAGGTDSGSAYVFTRSSGVWTQQKKLTSSDAAEFDQFGRFVSVSGDTVIVGAIFDDDGALTNSGSAYVFTRSGSMWTEQQKLTASDAAAGDAFGYSVAVSGNTAIVGAAFDDVGASNSGSAYFFTRSGGVWTQQPKLTASDVATDDCFGISVAADAGRFIVGAFGNDDPETDSGAAYVFDLVTPVVSSLSINGGAGSAASRTVTLNNAATNSPTHYLASESASFAGAIWQTYATAPAFTLSSGNGSKTVYFKVKNVQAQSAAVSDTIALNQPSGAEAVWMLLDSYD